MNTTYFCEVGLKLKTSKASPKSYHVYGEIISLFGSLLAQVKHKNPYMILKHKVHRAFKVGLITGKQMDAMFKRIHNEATGNGSLHTTLANLSKQSILRTDVKSLCPEKAWETIRMVSWDRPSSIVVADMSDSMLYLLQSMCPYVNEMMLDSKEYSLVVDVLTDDLISRRIASVLASNKGKPCPQEPIKIHKVLHDLPCVRFAKFLDDFVNDRETFRDLIRIANVFKSDVLHAWIGYMCVIYFVNGGEKMIRMMCPDVKPLQNSSMREAVRKLFPNRTIPSADVLKPVKRKMALADKQHKKNRKDV